MDQGDKTLLLLVASNRRRGAEVFGERLATGLTDLGWKVDFVAIQEADTNRTVAAAALSPSKASGRLNPRTIIELRRRIRTHRPTIVMANGGATLRYAVAALSGLRDRPRLAYGSIGEPRYWLRSSRHVVLQRFFHKRPDVILAVSTMTRDQLISNLGVPPTKVHVAPTGVPPEFFTDGHREPSAAELRLLFLGSLSAEKDPHRAIDTAIAIGGRRPVRLRLVGAGPLQEEIVARIATLPDRVTVELTGSVEDVKPNLEWADLLLLTSQSEGLPGAILEAGAAAVPAVAFDVGGTRETMIDGVSGIVVSPGATDSMVEAIEQLAAEPARLREMGRAQQHYVRDNYSLDGAVARFDEILSAQLGAGR